MASVPAAGKFVLDPAASSVALDHKTMWGMVTVHGVFERVDGVGEVHEDGTAGGVITLDTASINTKHTKRDAHLRSDAFFDVEKFPSIQLEVVDAVRKGDSAVDISGYLKIHGIAKPLSLTAKILGVDADAVTLSTEFAVDRADFQMGWNQLGMIRGLAHVTATLRFVRRES